jgi:hypothetical protein
VTLRGEEVVSGRMMPTFWPLPSTAPPALALLPDEDLLEDGVEELFDDEEPEDPWLLLLEPQAVREIAATTPSAASDAPVLRIR